VGGIYAAAEGEVQVRGLGKETPELL